MIVATRKVDVAIVGYGIEGRMLAQMITSLGQFEKVVAFDAPHPLNLGADSTRNHSVIHFGLFYGEKNLVAATNMAYSGHRMHEIVGLPIPSDGGILAVNDEDEVEKVFAIAKQLKIENQVWKIQQSEAQKKLAEFYSSEKQYVRIPETVFKEDMILEKLDFMARELGLELIKEKISLVPSNLDENKCYLKSETEIFEADFIILAAGAGLLNLFEQIGIDHSLKVFRTPIMRFLVQTEMEATLFIDKSKKGLGGEMLAVARHEINQPPYNNFLVIAQSMREDIKDPKSEREVTLEEEQKIRNEVPTSILPERDAKGYRVIAGYKTEFIDQNGNSAIDSKLLDCGSYGNIIGVIPGKATLAFDAAYQVMSWLTEKAKIETKQIISEFKNTEIIDVKTNKVQMHYDPIYDDLLDERVH